MVLIVVGVRPDAQLAAAAGATLGAKGAIFVDPEMRTTLRDVFAAGDCAVTHHRLLGESYLPLGTTAHKQGRVAGENALGGSREFAGSLGTQVVKIFDQAAARTGLRDHEAIAAGFDPSPSSPNPDDHKAYYPGSHRIQIRLTGDRKTGRLLGVRPERAPPLRNRQANRRRGSGHLPRHVGRWPSTACDADLRGDADGHGDGAARERHLGRNEHRGTHVGAGELRALQRDELQLARPTAKTSFHPMCPCSDKSTGVAIPYSSVWATLRKGGKIVFDERLWPMISRYMGPHYGNNVALPSAGLYHLTLLVSPPEAARHIEYKNVWLTPHKVNLTFRWVPPATGWPGCVAQTIFSRRRFLAARRGPRRRRRRGCPRPGSRWPSGRIARSARNRSGCRHASSRGSKRSRRMRTGTRSRRASTGCFCST